jgi:hypothetical protein
MNGQTSDWMTENAAAAVRPPCMAVKNATNPERKTHDRDETEKSAVFQQPVNGSQL